MNTNFIRRVLVACFITLASSAVIADPITGTPPLSSIAGGPFDSINLANLDVHFSIPIFSRAGVSLPFTYSLINDSLVWVPTNLGGSAVWTPVSNWGWRASTDAATGYVTNNYSDTVKKCGSNNQEVEKWSNFVYHDAGGTSHPFPLGSYIQIVDDPGSCYHNYSFTSATATDNSGYVLFPGSADTGDSSISTTIKSSAGLTIIPPSSNYTSGNGSVTDPNNNHLTITVYGSTTTLTDTLGTTALTIYGNPPTSNCESSPVYYKYSAPGATATVTVNYTHYYVQTNFAVSGISEFPATYECLVSRIDMPDYTYYYFGYETTVGNGISGKTTGRLASITLPTGGVISYSYAGSGCGNYSNCMMADGSPTYTTRSLGGGAWTYVRGYQPGSSGSYLPQQTTLMVVDPANNETDLNFSGIYETMRTVYQGRKSAVLDYSYMCYNVYNGDSACPNAVVTAPISWRAHNDHENQISFGVPYSSIVDYYDTYANLTYENDYTYASPPTLIRQVHNTYNPCTAQNICNEIASSQINDGGGLSKSYTTYLYDQGGNTHGKVTTIYSSSSGSTGGPFLARGYGYNSNGTLVTTTDPNGYPTYYNQSGYSCNGAFPNSIWVYSIYIANWLTTKYTYNCTGGVVTSVTDPNNATASTNYTDAYYWRPRYTTDRLGYATWYNYYGVNNTGGSVVTAPGQSESVMNFTSGGGNSTADQFTQSDPYGRLQLQQTREGPGSTWWDTTEYWYDYSGRLVYVAWPFATDVGDANSGNGQPSTWYTYDGLGRVVEVTDNWSGYSDIKYSYNFNDVKVTAGPGQTFIKQYEYDALGRLTSVCELTSANGSKACGQNTGATGYFSSYGYDPLSNLLSVNQSGQTRSFSFDGLSRLLSETNPETTQSGSGGTSRYVYDSINDGVCTSYSSAGDKVERVDPAGNYSCYYYDALHRPWYITYPRGPNTAGMPAKYYWYDLASPWGVNVSNALGRLSIAYTYDGTNVWSANIFSYDARGSITSEDEYAPGYWYDITQSYLANGVPGEPTGYLGLNTNSPFSHTFGYSLDPKGRPLGIWDANNNNQIIWTWTTYNPANQPTEAWLWNGSNLTESFNYDHVSGRMTQWVATAGGKQQVGNLAWNANTTLGQLNITDSANGSNNQTCSYGYDDVARLASANCGSAWNENFSYDAYGNITSTGSGGNNFSYNQSNNHINGNSYDGMGNTTYDKAFNYSYDAEGKPITANGINTIFDAFGRAVMKSGNINPTTEILYAPSGQKFAFMNGNTVQQYLIPLIAGLQAVYNGSALQYYRYSDWLGSVRFEATPSGSVVGDQAYAPYGETYAASSPIYDFTGQTKDTVANHYDFLAREFGGGGVWAVPDPAGLAAVDITNPQSWNRYAYVEGNPMSNTDPLGLDDDCIYDECGSGVEGGFIGDNKGDTGGSGDEPVYVPCAPNDPSCNVTVSAPPPPDVPIEDPGFTGQLTVSPGGGGGGGSGSGGASKVSTSTSSNNCIDHLTGAVNLGCAISQAPSKPTGPATTDCIGTPTSPTCSPPQPTVGQCVQALSLYLLMGNEFEPKGLAQHGINPEVFAPGGPVDNPLDAVGAAGQTAAQQAALYTICSHPQ